MLVASQDLKELSKYKIQKTTKIIAEFCKQNIGKLKNRKFVPVKLSYVSSDCMGMYDPVKHEVIIYVNSCRTVSDLTSTIIHEWTHSCQRVLTEYVKLYKKFGYENHPMEIEAYAAEKKWNRKALNFLKKNW